jgi:hypothetical protein
MRRLTSSERRLLGFLGLAIFLVVNFFAFRWLGQQKKQVEIDLARLKIQKINADAWMKDRDMWLERKAWLDAKQPKLAQAGEFAEALKTSADKYKIKIETQELSDTVNTKFYQEVTVKMKVNATLEGLTRWMIELQQPDLFQVITHLSLKSDKEKPESRVSCELNIARRCAPKI